MIKDNCLLPLISDLTDTMDTRNIKTLNLTVEYAFQLEAYINT